MLQIIKDLLMEEMNKDRLSTNKLLLDILKEIILIESNQDKEAVAAHSKYSHVLEQVVIELEEITSFISSKGKDGATTQEIKDYLSDSKKHPSVIRDRLDKLLRGNLIKVEKEQVGNFKRNVYYLNSSESAPPVP